MTVDFRGCRWVPSSLGFDQPLRDYRRTNSQIDRSLLTAASAKIHFLEAGILVVYFRIWPLLDLKEGWLGSAAAIW